MNGVVSEDPLDSANYDPVIHLNRIFSHPTTLASVDSTASALGSHVKTLDTQIDALVGKQADTDKTNVERMVTAKADLQELFEKIENVRGRAISTEEAISSMTADIKRLDATKRNLTLSMTALKRLQMLTTAYEQLNAQCKSRQYRECAQLLEAVIQLMAHFKSYRSIDQIATLSRNVANLQSQLLEQVCEDFEVVFAKGEVSAKKSMLAEACQVMDALGDTARLRLINWFCNTQLREYRQVFRGSDEAGSLDNISRRYAWLKRILKTYDEEHASIFPVAWKVNEVLSKSFCDGTKDDFKGILARSMRKENGKSLDVNLLLTCLQETLELEHWLDKRFVTTTRRMSLDTNSSSIERPPNFGKAISEAFEPYLSLWVDSQDKALSTMIPSYKSQPIRPADEEFSPQAVVGSSIELFQFYKVSFAQCAMLATGSKLYDLSRIFAKHLDEYAEQVLLSFLPERPNAPGPPIENVITVLNTADYSHTLCAQIEEKFTTKVEQEYKDKCSFERQQDSFMGVASAAIRALVRKVEVELEPSWREMKNTPWSKLENVGDQSTYVGELMRILKEKSSEILEIIVKDQYKRAFCDRLVEYVSASLLGNLVSCKPISDIGAEQMLLDLYVIKKGLEELLTINSEPGTTAPAGYIKHVSRSVAKVDTILKVIQVRSSPPEGLVQAYLIHIADKSDTNFRKILDLKGIRKGEQAALVELFHAHRSAHDNLADSSPLMQALNLGSSHIGPNLGLGPQSGIGQLGIANLQASALAGRFDAAGLSSAFMSGVREVRDGVDRLGSPSLGSGALGETASSSPGVSTPLSAGSNTDGSQLAATARENLNENLQKFGRFFRRDLGSRFGNKDTN